MTQVCTALQDADELACQQVIVKGDHLALADLLIRAEESIRNMHELLRRVDHTLSMHGHVDGETELHRSIQAFLYPGAALAEPMTRLHEATHEHAADRPNRGLDSPDRGHALKRAQDLANWEI